MKHLNLLRGGLSLLAIAASLAVLPNAARAQTEVYSDAPANDPFDNSATSGDRNPLEGEGGLNMLDIIHRTNMTGGMTIEEFSSGQDGRLNNAAQDFRSRQLELIRQREAMDADSASDESVEP